MAVAAWEGSLTLYALKSMDQLKEELESGGKLLGGRFLPIKTVCTFSMAKIGQGKTLTDSLRRGTSRSKGRS